MSNLYFYKAKVIRCIDGDTLVCLIDLGFKSHMKATIRLLDVHAPETRTRDVEEKVQGLEIKDLLTEYIESLNNEIFLYSASQGSFSRWLGIIYADENKTNCINEMINDWIIAVKTKA